MITTLKDMGAVCGDAAKLMAASACLLAAGACTEKRVATSEPATPPRAEADQLPGVPDNDTNYVVTPAGLYHRSCIHEIPDHSVVRGNVVALPNGHTITLPTCAYPHRSFASQGRVLLQEAGTTGWILDAEDTVPVATNSWRNISASWGVPNNPPDSYSTSQAWYTFPGIINAPGILQPVLSYNETQGSGWQISVWYCDLSCPHSTFASVSVGDAINGSIVSSNCSGGNCDFTITVTDATHSATRQATYTSVPDNGGTLVGGALEGHDMNSCSDYPQSQVAYTSISATDRFGSSPTAWTSVQRPNYNSLCGTALVSTATSVTIRNVSLSVNVGGSTSVNTGASCSYEAVPNGGYAPNSFTWIVDGTILDGQNTGSIDAEFTDGIHAVTVVATDGQGNHASNTLYVDSESAGERGCDRT